MRRWSTWLGATALALLSGCAHSEQEWDAQVRANEQLRAKLSAEQARNKKSHDDGAEAAAKLERLQQELRAAGIDPENLARSVEAQARATEEHRRRHDYLEAQKKLVDRLRTQLAQALPATSIAVRNNRLTIELPGDALFENGRETLKQEGRAMIATLAGILRADAALAARTYQVAGHVDALPPGGRFKDAVAFSAARAHEVLAVLLDRVERGGGGLNPARWSIAAYGDADPATTKDTLEGKQRNRRCEIVMQPAPEERLDLHGLGAP
jgi:chemotaxis protein MotB